MPVIHCTECGRQFLSERGVNMHMRRSQCGKSKEESNIQSQSTPTVKETTKVTQIDLSSLPIIDLTLPTSQSEVKTKVKKVEPVVARRSPPNSPISKPKTTSTKKTKREESDDDEPSPKRKKTPKKEKKEKKEEEDKRPARWRDKPNQGVRDRISRAKSQRMFLISRKEIIPNLSSEFVVLGSVGNVYNVKINQSPSCTCPDFDKGNLCKHVLFVFLKVLRVKSSSELIYQKGLLKSELRSIFESAPKDPSSQVVANETVKKKYQEINNKDKTSDTSNRKPIDGEDCPICYEEMNSKEDIVWCKNSCGNNLHAGCFKTWSDTKTRNREEITCVWCRAPWGVSKEKMMTNEGYLNLANYQPGMTKDRDYTEYDWRSEHYGYGYRYGYRY